MATISLTIILYFLKYITRTAIIASLGATTFIISIIPKYATAQSRKVIGEHVVGIIVGIFCFYIASLTQNKGSLFHTQNVLKIFIPSLSIGLSIFTIAIATPNILPLWHRPKGNDSGLVLFHDTCYLYHYFPLTSVQIFTKTMVKRFSLTVIYLYLIIFHYKILLIINAA